MRFIRTDRYLKDLKRLRVSLDEAWAIERTIATHPAAGDVIVGLKGARKLRFALGKRGKSGGGRAIYFLMLADEKVVLLTAYAKNEQSDLTPAVRKLVRGIIEELSHD